MVSEIRALNPKPGASFEQADVQAVLPENAALVDYLQYTRLVPWQDGVLVGGLYGVSIGGLFAGESMFHTVRDASKVALVGLVERFHRDGDPRRLVDVQWATEHLGRLGAQEWSRETYLARLAEALNAPQVDLSA